MQSKFWIKVAADAEAFDAIAEQFHELAEKAQLNIRFLEVLQGFYGEDAK